MEYKAGLTRQIENAQKRVEARNFDIRKQRAAVRRRDEPAARNHLRPAPPACWMGEDMHEQVHQDADRSPHRRGRAAPVAPTNAAAG